mmetsp:Transcript_6845/g.20780  ORF Transcript_6845/g.20780 Transcript_6845/m.20780 type:complete len:250 (-) Transcript_6845:207-956(-)
MIWTAISCALTSAAAAGAASPRSLASSFSYSATFACSLLTALSEDTFARTPCMTSCVLPCLFAISEMQKSQSCTTGPFGVFSNSVGLPPASTKRKACSMPKTMRSPCVSSRALTSSIPFTNVFASPRGSSTTAPPATLKVAWQAAIVSPDSCSLPPEAPTVLLTTGMSLFRTTTSDAAGSASRFTRYGTLLRSWPRPNTPNISRTVRQESSMACLISLSSRSDACSLLSKLCLCSCRTASMASCRSFRA